MCVMACLCTRIFPGVFVLAGSCTFCAFSHWGSSAAGLAEIVSHWSVCVVLCGVMLISHFGGDFRVCIVGQYTCVICSDVSMVCTIVGLLAIALAAVSMRAASCASRRVDSSLSRFTPAHLASSTGVVGVRCAQLLRLLASSMACARAQTVESGHIGGGVGRDVRL